MKGKAFFSVDMEEDLHSSEFRGVVSGVPELIELLENEEIKATFFATGKVMEKHSKILSNLVKNGHSLGFHGYTHKRFDSLSTKEKENEIKKGISLYKKISKKILLE